MNAADSTVLAACITAVGYAAVAVGQRSIFKKSGNIEEKVDAIATHQEQVARTLATHTVNDERAFNDLREAFENSNRRLRRRPRGLIGLALTAVLFLFK